MSQFWKILVPEGAPERRYEILQEIASGGMATVYLGSQRGEGGFERIVALKRALPPRDGVDPSLLLRREARIAARVRHPNVVSVFDVVLVEGALLLVMEYVEGASLGQLLAGGPLEPRVLARILLDVLGGLAAIHDTRNEAGTLIGLVHRDVSPQNLMVGTDGVTRVIDFGIATARGSVRTTGRGARRGKLGYMSPRYLAHGTATPACDLFALAVITWESLTGTRLYPGADTLEQVAAMHDAPIAAPGTWDPFVLRALGRSREPRYESAVQLERALLDACGGDVAAPYEVAELVEQRARDALWLRRAIVHERLRCSQPDLAAASWADVSESQLSPDECSTTRVEKLGEA